MYFSNHKKFRRILFVVVAILGPHYVNNAQAQAQAQKENEILIFSPQLTTYLNASVQKSPEVKLAKKDYEASLEDVKTVRWQRYPSLSIDSFASADKDKSSELRFAIEQPLLSFGKLDNRVKQSLLEAKLASYGLEKEVQDISTETIKLYFDSHRQKQRIQILQNSVKRHKAYVDTIKRRYEQGVSSKVDLDLSELRLAQIQQQLTDSELRFRISNTKLLELSGFSEVSIGKDISDKLFENKLELNTININSNNNDVKLKMASAELELSKLESKYAGLEAYPNLVMQYSNDQLYGERFGFQLRAQSGSGLSLLSKYKSATLKNDVKEYNIQKIERDIENENMVKYQTYIHYVIRNSRTSDINDFSFSITESYIRQFVAGKKSWLEVMNSERDLVSSQLDAVENFSSAAEIFSIFELSLSGYASQFLRELHE